jgi:hypothetical protein
METYYLKAVDEQSLWEALEAAGLAHKQYDPQDPLNQPPETTEEAWEPRGAYDWVQDVEMLDVIGTIYSKTGNMLTDADGFEYPEMVAQEGYHANLRAELTDEQAAALPTIAAPTTPMRIWAGDE